MRAVSEPPKRYETPISVYDKKTDRLMFWGGMNNKTGQWYIVFTPPKGIPHYSVKQERLFKTFLIGAHIHFSMTGDIEYAPEKIFDCYKLVFPREFYPFGTEQVLPDFKVAG